MFNRLLELLHPLRFLLSLLFLSGKCKHSINDFNAVVLNLVWQFLFFVPNAPSFPNTQFHDAYLESSSLDPLGYFLMWWFSIVLLPLDISIRFNPTHGLSAGMPLVRHIFLPVRDSSMNSRFFNSSVWQD